MRIVTRPDFDGIVCAALLSDVLNEDVPIEWAEPNAVQNGRVEIKEGDIIANLAYNDNCLQWFDHHLSNQIDKKFNGSFRIAPSAARVVYDFYKDQFNRNFRELVKAADKIDAARLSLDEVFHPENYPYIALDMTIVPHKMEDEPYWNRLVFMLLNSNISEILKDQEVSARIEASVKANREFMKHLQQHSYKEKNVIVTDFRSLKKAPSGNRFLVFCLFPEANVHVKIRYHDREPDKVIVSVGHSILNRTCKVNSGKLCARFSGGGHKGAGSCSFPSSQAEANIEEIMNVLLKNKEEKDECKSSIN